MKAKKIKEDIKRIKRRPLERAVFATLLTGMIVLLMMAGMVLLVLYPYLLLHVVKSDADEDIEYVTKLMDTEYLEDIYERTKETYFSLPEEERSDPYTEEFRDHFVDMVREEGYKKARDVVCKCREVQGYREMGFCFFDNENDRMVFVIDGDTNENAYLPGQWVSKQNGSINSPDTIKKIMKSKWRMGLNYAGLSGLSMTDYREITDRQGNPIGVAYTDVNIADFFRKMGAFTGAYLFLMMVVIVVMITYLSEFLRKRIVQPIGRLSDTAQAYAKRDKTAPDETHSYFSELDIYTGDEIEDLWVSLAAMEEDINDTMSRIREMTSAQERMNTELGIASQIQADMLPCRFPPFPERDDFELYAMMTPAREVGGDFYDFFLVDDDHIALVIADVSDKGVPAALFMMTARTLIKTKALMKSSPAEILSYANGELCEGNEASLFVTVWMAVIELSTGRGVASNAGHMHPAFMRNGGKYALVEYDHDLPLGLISETTFRQHEFRLEPGDRFFVYTDGVTDVADQEDRQLGSEGMLESLNRSCSASSEETLKRLMDDIRAFSEGVHQPDDITMLGFIYRAADTDTHQ